VNTKLDRHAKQLAALGHPIRLAILRFVVQGGDPGTAAGEIQSHVDLSGTLADASQGGTACQDVPAYFVALVLGAFAATNTFAGFRPVDAPGFHCRAVFGRGRSHGNIPLAPAGRPHTAPATCCSAHQ
jgi:hypothetical protein